MVDFRSIETFLWVVTLGSFRGAAQRLNTTQPAISQRIAKLEREMGVKLLNREHRVASPTANGRQLMVYAEKLIGLRSEMMAAVGDARRHAAWRSRDRRAHLAVATNQKRQHRLSQSVAGDRSRYHAEPERTAVSTGNRTVICTWAIVRFQRTQSRAVRLSRRLSRQSRARPRQGSADGAGAGEVSDHHLSAQNAAL